MKLTLACAVRPSAGVLAGVRPCSRHCMGEKLSGPLAHHRDPLAMPILLLSRVHRPAAAGALTPLPLRNIQPLFSGPPPSAQRTNQTMPSSSLTIAALAALLLAATSSTHAALVVPAGLSVAHVEILGCPPVAVPRRALADLGAPPCGACRLRLVETGAEGTEAVAMRATKLSEARIVFTSVDGGSVTHVTDSYPRNGLGNQATVATIAGPAYTAAFTPPSFGFEGETASFTGALRNNARETVCEFEADFSVVAP